MKLEVAVTCTKCEQVVLGRIHLSDRLQVVDTDGGMLFDTGWTCHNCLRQPWSTSDLTLNLTEEGPL